MKEKVQAPELRFPGFTDDWEERKLGDVTTWTKGQGLTKEDLNKERDGSEAVHYADLYKFSPVMHEVIHWTNSDDGQIIPDNSLLFPASDVTPVGLARTSTLRLSGVKAGGDVIIGQLDESINSSFMSYQINANSKKILPLITGTTVKHIQAKSLATVSVSITNMAEQTAIAGIFEQLDETIALHQRKLDLLKEQKKGYLQKMFPKNGEKVPELRFAGFADDWEERKFADFIDVKSGKDYKHLNSGSIPVYGTGGYMLSVDRALSDIDAIGIGRKGTIDKPYLLKAPFWTVDTLFYAVPKQNIDLQFSLSIFKKINWKKFDESTGVPSLSKTVINSVSVAVPSYEEQQKIGAFFKQLDDTIALHQRKLDLLKEQKKGFLQKMFV